MLEYFRSTNVYKKMSQYGFYYSVISVLVYFSIPKGLGGLLIFIPFAFLHFAVGLFFIAGIIAANAEQHSVPLATDFIYDIGFIISFIIILGPLIMFILGCILTFLGVIH